MNLGDKSRVVVDQQFNDLFPRRVGQIGTVTYIDEGDEWAYKLTFGNGSNWFKRYYLEKVN